MPTFPSELEVMHGEREAWKAYAKDLEEEVESLKDRVASLNATIYTLTAEKNVLEGRCD